MSLLYTVVFAAKATSNHHRLALDALRHVRGADAEAWRMAFLHHHAAYLEGAKAPDVTFKDFKNHVLHVREGEWGGAIEAAQEWYRRTVRALTAQDWKLAIYNAGVMSHYVVDPFQPFHTHQTEEEGVIHAAVEQSFSKSWKTLQTILEVDLGGYPEVELASGEDWLAAAIRAGAVAANPSYELVINHYDFAAGKKNPPAGLDQEIKDAIAPLIGLASVTLARILERAIAEAAVAPPKVDGSLDVVFTALSGPVTWITGKLEDQQAAALVRAQYAEFQARGKVLNTLHEDDATVRQLHCQEVLGKPLSSLDAAWPRETGAAHGQGAPPRTTRRPKRNRWSAKAAPRADAPLPGRGLFNTRRLPQSQEIMAQTPQASSSRAPLLAGADPVVDAPSIGPKTAARLHEVGVNTVAELMAAPAEDLAGKLAVRHISAPVVRDWQDQALLACTVANLSGRAAQTLVACGVRTPQSLSTADAQTLLAQAQSFATTEDGQRLWRGTAIDAAMVEGWISAAQPSNGSSSAAA
jgi:predicted flap endonuclease-1-like 5' DNA nuclease